MTPEIIAEYTAKLAKNCTVIDGFCGSGGNVIQFSKFCKKVYAIDIDPKKIEICKNNCKVYKCDNNIYFIKCDFLKIENYSQIKVNADYIFLSPPWGGISYKNSDIYSIKQSMSPDIHEIIKVSLRISKYIMFYVPRTLMLEELFGIVSDIKKNSNIFFDIHILKSANKIKALLIIFGYDVDKKIVENDITEYLKNVYDEYTFDEMDFGILNAIAKVIGNFKFFENELNFRKNLADEEIENIDLGKKIFNYFFQVVLTDHEKIKIKSLKIYSLFKKSKNKNKNCVNNNMNIITRFNFSNNNNFIENHTLEYTSDNIESIVNEEIKNKSIENIDLNFNSYKKKFELKTLDNDNKTITRGSSYNYETLSTSPSVSIPILNKINKDQGDEMLMPCKEINLNYHLG